MEVYGSLSALNLRGCTVCIGAFDGVHVGHQALLTRLLELSRSEKSPAVIVTFDPPPKTLFMGSKYLSSLEEKLRCLSAFEPDAVVAIPFSRDYARTPKEAFLEDLRRLEPRGIIVGENFRFGKDRAGGLDDLSHVAPKLEVFGLQELEGVPVSSSLIRSFLESGRLEEAKRFLGRSYFATGTVVEGAKRGRSIGFPTANLDLPPLKALPTGVFAGLVETPYGKFGGMANVGPRPSFPDAPPTLEVHLFDVAHDLYGQNITVFFQHLLREQRRFGSLEDLSAQLREDMRQARALLNERASKVE